MAIEDFKEGAMITSSDEIFDYTGRVLLRKGQVVTIERLIYSGGFWGARTRCWIAERLQSVILEECNGSWPISHFEEFNK